MMIVGFDQAPKGIGWAYGPPGSVPARGYRELPDYGDNTARLFKAAADWVEAFAKSIGAERIYFEQIIVRKHGLHMPTLHKQFMVACGVQAAASRLGLEDECYEALIADWRTEFYGGLRPAKSADSESDAWKAMAITECARRGWLIENHNTAEACGIWDFGCKCADPTYRHRARVTTRRQQTAIDNARREAM